MSAMFDHAAAKTRAFACTHKANNFRMMPEILCMAERMASDMRVNLEIAVYFQSDLFEAPFAMSAASSEASNVYECIAK